MSDLVEFLRARTDEDEASARQVASDYGDQWTSEGDDRVRGSLEYVDVLDGPGSPTEYIARHDPKRVLAEVEAKRRIISMHAESDFPHNPDDGPGDYSWTARCDGCYETAPCTTLRLLASVYADHPDYRPEWAPTA